MKIKPIHLFLIVGFLSIIIGVITKSLFIDVNVYDTYLVITYLQIATIITVSCGVIISIYIFMNFLNRPIKKKYGFLHFSLFLCGTVFLLVFQIVARFLTETFYPNDKIYESHYWIDLIILIGPLLIFISLIIFGIGFINAFKQNKLIS